jgi:hypothetical protein
MRTSFAKSVSNYWVLGLVFIIAIHLLLISHIMFFPYPELFIYPYLANHGLIPYKQIFDQHFPGLMFFPVNLNNLGMITPQIARYWHLFLIVATQIILFFTAKKFLKSVGLALITCLAFIIFQPYFEGYVLWIETFITPILLLSFYFLMDYKKKINLFWAGLLIGVAILFKQVVLPFTLPVLIYLLIFNKLSKKNFYFLLGLCLPLIILAVFITRLNIWKDFIYWTFIYNLTVFSQVGRKFATLTDIIKITPIFVIPLLLIFYTFIKEKSDKYSLLLTFYVGSVLFVYARFDFIHLQPMLPFALVGLVLFLSRMSRKILIATICIYLFYSFRLLVPFYKLSFNQKTLFFGDFEEQLVAEVKLYAKPGESIFVMGTTPHLYFLSNTLPPGRVFVFQFPWFMKVVETKILDGLKRDPPKVVFRDKYAHVQGMTLINYFGEINTYIEDRYKVVDNINGTEVLLPR